MEPLAEPADLEVYAPNLGLPSTRAEVYIAQASAAVRSYCGWHIAPSVTEAVTVDGSGALIQPLPTLLLTAVNTITEDGTAVTVADVEWSAAGFLKRTTPWTSKLRGLVSNITHGHAENPAEIVALVCSIVGRAAVSPTGEVREQTGPFGVTRTQVGFNQAGGIVLLEHEQRIADRYRLP